MFTAYGTAKTLVSGNALPPFRTLVYRVDCVDQTAHLVLSVERLSGAVCSALDLLRSRELLSVTAPAPRTARRSPRALLR